MWYSMIKDKRELIKKLFEQNNGYARTRELVGCGINPAMIKQIEWEGLITKVKHGLYRWTEYEVINSDEELIEVTHIAPNGVLCLLSALSYYELTTYNPWQYYIAILRDSGKPSGFSYPPIKFVSFTEKYYYGGLQEIELSGHKIKIYDMEKTLCDCIRFRNKLGIDIISEALKNYISRPDKDIGKLVEYSKMFRIKSVLSNYLEVL